ETSVSQSDGGRIYVETSSREQYLPTRAFYLASGYRECAFFDDFYAPDDAKVVLVKPAAAPVIRRPPETR
ncbi:MAG: hypothetical protein KKB20_12150, partial [Proteobacteria bacterium]|nr:hypothetical protein [Pseudomonadota bacterium]